MEAPRRAPSTLVRANLTRVSPAKPGRSRSAADRDPLAPALIDARGEAVEHLRARRPEVTAVEERVDLLLLAALFRSFLEAVGQGGRVRAWAGFLGFPEDGAAPEELGALAPRSAPVLAELLREAPWLQRGAAGLEQLLRRFSDARQRKELGKFYTPENVVAHILDRVLAPALERAEPGELKVLEPSCGAGDFAVPVYDRIVTAWQSRGLPLEEAARLALERNLFAVDRDPISVAVTRVRLAVHSLDAWRDTRSIPTNHVFHEDALWDGLEPPPLQGETLPLPLPRSRSGALALRNGHGLLATHAPFDVVVGNPPYGAHLEPDEKAWLRRRYALARGRTDTAALFLERGLELLAPGGGMGFVMPHSFSRSGAYRPARDLLVERLRLDSLVDLGDDFPGISFNTMVFTGTAGGTRARAKSRVELLASERGELVVRSRIPRSFLRGRDTLPMHVANEDVAFYLGMEERGLPLRELVRNERGANLARRRERVGHSREDDAVPIVQGRDLEPYAILDPGALPRVDRAPDVVSIGPDPLIGLQNVSNVIEATLIPGGTLPLDTVNLLVIDHEEIDRDYLIAVLNSSVLGAYFRDAVINRATLTLHLDDPVLGGLPIIVPPGRIQRKVAKRVRRLLGIDGEPEKGDKRQRLIREVDFEINRIYGVDEDRAHRLARGTGTSGE